MNQLTSLEVEWVSLVDRAAVRNPFDPSQPQRFLLAKNDVPLWKAGGATPDPIGGSMTEEELRAALQKAESERDEAIAKATKAEEKLAKKAKKSKEADEAVEIDKSELPEPVRAALAKAEESEKAALAKAEEAEKLAKSERDLRVEREFVTKAESDFPNVGDPTTVGPRLKRMSETLSKEDYDAHLTDLAAMNEQIAKGDLFREIGRGGEPPVGQTGAADLSKLQKSAEDIRKADSSLSHYEAMHLAMTQDREAQARYLSSVR